MFSVIIPAYNAAPFIAQSVGSVLAQTVGDFEILVVDDGSVDETRAVVERLEDSRIRYIHQENQGVSAARNTGIVNAGGDYVCFLDADDLWLPEHLEVVSGLIEKFPACGVYLTGHQIRLHNGETLIKNCGQACEDAFCTDNMFRELWERGYFIHTNSIVCKKSAVDQVGLFEVGVKNGEDDDMWYRLFSYCSAAISKKPTTMYVRQNSRATATKVFVDNWVFLRRKDHILASPEVPENRKRYLRMLLEQRKLSEARNLILRGEKKTAWFRLRQVDRHLVRGKKYWATVAAFLIPSGITARMIKARDGKYFRE